jgi:hypothetical protein
MEEREIEVTLEASIDSVDIGLLSVRIERGLSVWHLTSSGTRLAISAAVSLQVDGRVVPPTVCGPSQWSWKWESHSGQIACLVHSVAMTRAGAGDADPGRGAQDTRTSWHAGTSGVSVVAISRLRLSARQEGTVDEACGQSICAM